MSLRWYSSGWIRVLACWGFHHSHRHGLPGKAGLLVDLQRYTGGTVRSFPYVCQSALMFANQMVLHGFQ
jgi:hypothetical protein